MAERRMFTKKITDDDNFMELSSSAQALYFHLSMGADDDGFCNQINIAMFKAHASIQDLQALLAKRYLYQFENGVIVIKHWRMANALRKDRYTPTAFQEELARLKLKDNGAYTLDDTWQTQTDIDGNNVVAERLPDGCHAVAERLPQDSIGKNSIDNTKEKPSKKKSASTFVPPTVESVSEYCRERGNDIDAEEFVDFYQSKGWMVGKNKMKDWKACVRTWERSHKNNGVKRTGKNGIALAPKEEQDHMLDEIFGLTGTENS